MNPKALIAPVLTGAVIAVAMAVYINAIKKDLKQQQSELGTIQTQLTEEKGRVDKAEKAKSEALAKLESAEKTSTERIAELTSAKSKAESDLMTATSKVAELNSQMDALKASSAKLTKDSAEKNNQLEDTKKKLADAETLKAQAEQKLKIVQTELAEAKRAVEAAKEPGYLSQQYKANADSVRKQVEQLLNDAPELAAKLAGASPAASASSADPLRQDMTERMVTLNIEGQFNYTNENGDAINDALTWSVGAVVIGMDANQVYMISTPPPHLLDQQAARNSLTKNCNVYFSVHPAGWSGVKDPLPAIFLGALRGSGGATVGVFSTAVADWPQAREKPIGLIPAPTIQECRQWSVNGDIGFVYSRGMPAGPGSGPVRMDALLRMSEQEVGLVLPAQAVGYELGLFGTRRAASDKPILGVYYPEGSRILWLSDLYNGVKGLAAEAGKRAEVGAVYVSADWVVGLGERPTTRPVDTVIADFVNFIEKR